MALAGATLQEALQSTLANDAGLVTLMGSGKVFDYFPQGVGSPFLIIGDDGDVEAYSAGFSDTDAEAHEHALTFHIYAARQTGRLPVKRIMSRLHDVLINPATREDLTLTGFTVVDRFFVAAMVTPAEDDLSYHGLFRCRCVTHPV